MSSGQSVSSVAQSCPTLCDPMNRSTPGLPVHHKLPEFTQTHAHRVGDALQPSHSLSSPSPPAPNPSQHQGLSNESALGIRWPKYWSFSVSTSPYELFIMYIVVCTCQSRSPRAWLPLFPLVNISLFSTSVTQLPLCK